MELLFPLGRAKQPLSLFRTDLCRFAAACQQLLGPRMMRDDEREECICQGGLAPEGATDVGFRN